MVGWLEDNLKILFLHPKLIKTGGILMSADGRAGGWSVSKTLFLKILPQFSSHQNETCYTWSL